jgi:hypothetical protein
MKVENMMKLKLFMWESFYSWQAPMEYEEAKHYMET